MSLQDTPKGERLRIALFGRRNAGKSSLINAVTGQAASLVSPVAGTTTDPVEKTMELLPLGPVLFIDTPGYDDAGPLGALRVERTRQVAETCDLALLVMDGTLGKTAEDAAWAALFTGLPVLEVYTKGDLPTAAAPEGRLLVSAETGDGIEALKEAIARSASQRREPPSLLGDLVQPGELVVLVTPIDSAAPKGRLILPQQQTIRELLDIGATAVVCRETELAETLNTLAVTPALVITDSQAFAEVAALLPPDVPLTSFSILMARRKGLLSAAVHGIAAVKALQEGDTVLICEGCTHHRQCGDIGSVKLPRWLREHTGRSLQIRLCAGNDFPDDLRGVALVVHCGGCMLGERAVARRVRLAEAQGVPITNYGTLIAHMKGILPRSLAPFPALRAVAADVDKGRETG